MLRKDGSKSDPIDFFHFIFNSRRSFRQNERRWIKANHLGDLFACKVGSYISSLLETILDNCQRNNCSILESHKTVVDCLT